MITSQRSTAATADYCGQLKTEKIGGYARGSCIRAL